MSGSRKRNPIGGITTAESEKEDKRLASRRYRHAVAQALRAGRDDVPDRREVTDPWDFAKDGKRFRADANEGDLRK